MIYASINIQSENKKKEEIKMSGIFTMITIFAGVIVLLLLLNLVMIKPNKKRDVSKFFGKRYAHRGLHGSQIPENSKQAFTLAREQGYGVELDVQMTKDGHLVVFHDGTLKRMCGIEGKLRDFDYHELQKLSLKGTEERIPLFEEVLELLGETDLVCEIKSDNGIRNYELCRRVYKALQKYQGNYCIESFSPFLVRWWKLNHPEVIRGQLSCNMKYEPGQNAFMNFLLTNLYGNFYSKPDFIAYNFKDAKKAWGYRLCRRLYHPFCIAWTPRGKDEIEIAKKDFETIIFEKEPMHLDPTFL